MDGGCFYLVGHGEFKGATGTGTGISIWGYKAADKVYTYDAYKSGGDAEHAKGTIDGKTWIWTSESQMGGHTMKTRYTIKQQSPTSHDFKYEIAGADGSWSTVMEAKAIKQ